MSRGEALSIARALGKLRATEIDLMVNLAKFVAGARVGSGPPQEVR